MKSEKPRIDRSKWTKTWQELLKDEPDFKQWIDKETELPCLILRNYGSGGLCGYVGIAEGHPLYEKNYFDDDTDFIRIHGGITFTDKDQYRDGFFELENPRWWFGFDCNHAGDLTPRSTCHGYDAKYRDFDYVEREVMDLATQLKDE